MSSQIKTSFCVVHNYEYLQFCVHCVAQYFRHMPAQEILRDPQYRVMFAPQIAAGGPIGHAMTYPTFIAIDDLVTKESKDGCSN